MLTNFYSIYDVKAKIYAVPFPAVNAQVAMRSVYGAMLDPNSSLSRHPHDYRLFCVGQFDDESGLVFPEDTPQYICDVDELLPETVQSDSEVQDNA